MTKRVFGAALAASVFSCLVAGSAVAAPPVEAFGSLEAIKDVHLSPDGTHFSALEPVNGRFAVVVFEVHPAAGSKPLIYSLPDGNAFGSRWVNNDRLLCFFYQNKYHDESLGVKLRQFSRTVSVSISGKTKPFMLMEGSKVYAQNGGSTTYVAGTSVDDPNVVFMPVYEYYGSGDSDTRLGNGRVRLNLFSVNAETNHVETTEHGLKDTSRWIIDEHGSPVARVDSTDEDETPQNLDTFYAKDGSDWRELAHYGNHDGVLAYVDGITMDGTALAVEGYGEGDKYSLEAMPLKAGGATTTLFTNPNYDLGDAITDPWTNRVVGATYIGEKTEYQYFDPALAHVQKRLETALPGQTVELSSWNTKRDMFLVTAEDPHNPPGVYLFTTADSHLEYLMSAYPALQPADLGDVKPYLYKARDGMDIHAYLTMPPGKPAKNLPAVVMPHGGPDGRDSLGFDYWAQFMASRGYVVLQPNFRGSTGYGVAFRNAGFGQWGRKMQDDVTDGVKKMIADGIADPKRICIVGASYGGYAALAGATFTPDLYACAISYAGIADVASILGKSSDQAGTGSSLVHWWEQRVGATFADSNQLRTISPAYHADQVHTPILLLHSNNDLTVPVAQSEREASALTAAGRTVRFVKLDGDDHYLQRNDARIAVLREVEAFLAANIGH